MAIHGHKAKFLESIELDDVAIDAIEHLLISVEREITSNFLAKIEVPYATEQSMQKLYKILAWSTYTHDGLMDKKEPNLEKFQPDGEPSPVSIDPWARGTGDNSI